LLGGINVKCQRCHKKEAEVTLTKVQEGKKTVWHICSTCAQEAEEKKREQNLSFQQFLGGLLEGDWVENTDALILSCEKCGMSLDDFRKNSQVGCANCYRVFEIELHPIIKSLQSNMQHTGKRPRQLETTIKEERLIDWYQQMLQTVLKKEDYEQAVILRDKIHELKGESP